MPKISHAALLAAALSLGAMTAPVFAQDMSLEVSGDDTGTDTGTDDGSANTDVGFNISVPTVTAVDSTMDEDSLRQLFTGGFADQADELASLDATSIAIPEVTFTFSSSGGSGTATIHDITLNGVQKGIAASATVGSFTLDVTNKDSGDVSFKTGALNATALDFGAVLGFYGVTESLTGDDFRPAYANYSLDGAQITTPVFSCTLGSLTGEPLEMKSVGTSFMDYMTASQSMQGATPTPEQLNTVLSYLADAFTSERGGGGTWAGADCKNAGEAPPFTLHIGAMTTAAFQPGIYPDVTINDISVDAGPQGTFALKKFDLKPIDFTAPIALYRTTNGTATMEWLQTNARGLIPAFAGLGLSGFAVNAPNPSAPGQAVDVKFDDFDLTLGNYINGIPSQISSFLKGFEYPLPTNTTDPQMSMMMALGITKIDANYHLALAWDEASQSVKIDDVSVNAADLGSLAIAGTLGNALQQLFATDPNVALAAVEGMTLKNLSLNLVDDGMMNIAAMVGASQQGADPAAFRVQSAGQAEASILQTMGATDAAHQLATAVSNFVAGTAKTLGISIVANDPNGLSRAAIMQGAGDPKAVLGQVTITGTNP